MNLMGIGPVLAIVGAISAAIVIVLQLAFGIGIYLTSSLMEIVRVFGIVLIATGVYFWLSSARLVLRAFKAHRLETAGVFGLSRNPLYAAFIVFIIPGIGFVTNNLLILLISVAMFAAFKMRIGKEEEFLEKEFGDEFRQYAHDVSQLIPFLNV